MINSSSVERQSTPPPNFRQLAERVQAAGGWSLAESRALTLAADMNAQEWQALTAAIAQIGLTQLADMLRKRWCKVGTRTVSTIAAAVERITSTHNLTTMYPAAMAQMRQYDEELGKQLIAALERVSLTQDLAQKMRAKVAEVIAL